MELPRDARAELVAESELSSTPSFDSSRGQSLAEELVEALSEQGIDSYTDMKKREVTRDAMDALFHYAVVQPETEEELAIATHFANIADCSISEKNTDDNRFQIATGR